VYFTSGDELRTPASRRCVGGNVKCISDAGAGALAGRRRVRAEMLRTRAAAGKDCEVGTLEVHRGEDENWSWIRKREVELRMEQSSSSGSCAAGGWVDPGGRTGALT